MIHKGTAYRVFATEQADSTVSVTEVTVKLDDIGDKQVGFYVPADGPQPAYGDALAWPGGGGHVDVAPVAGGPPFRVHMIGYPFDPDQPLR